MIGVLCFLLLGVSSSYAATACTNHPDGYCVGMFLSNCPTGYYVSYSGCGFLEQCCYPKPQTSVTPAPTSGQCGKTNYNYGNKIVGGQSTVIDKYPWQVSVQYYNQHICGGSIIDGRWILTAAHCFDDLPGSMAVSHFSIIAGSTRQDRYYSRANNYYAVDKIITHANFVLNERNDIAMIKTSRSIDLSGSHKKKICLPSKGDTFTGEVCVATGWGAVHEDGPVVSQLREVGLPIISHNLCTYYMGYVHSSVICAGQRAGGIDSCQGDSGGPLVCQGSDSVWRQAGIVSYGVGCARKNLFGAYAEVSDFIDWIEHVKKTY